MKTLWLSFVGEDGFRGVTVVDVSPAEEAQALADFPEMADKIKGPTILAAVQIARDFDANPGGEVAGIVLEKPLPAHLKNRLLQKADLKEAGLI
jgi:hypothetical protein